MMGVEAPETCWATHKSQVKNSWNCCIWLVNLFELYDDARTCQPQKYNLLTSSSQYKYLGRKDGNISSPRNFRDHLINYLVWWPRRLKSKWIECKWWINPLNAELNPICHSLILLGDLSFYGYVHCKYIPIYIQQDATLHSLFITGNCSTCFGWYFHPSSGAHTTESTASGICHTVTATSTHHQEHIQLYLQHLVFVTPLLLPVAIMEDLRSVVDKMGISNQ